MTAEVLKSIIAGFSGMRVLVVGDVMLDKYLCGEVHRISPEAPIPVVRVIRQTMAPGGAANVAANIVKLGGKVLLCGVIGPDEEGSHLREVCRAAHVETTGLLVEALRSTTTKTRILGNGQQIVRLDREDSLALPVALEDRLLAWCKVGIRAADACVLSDYSKGIVTPRVAQELIRLARQRDKPVIVDPKGSEWRKYQGATLVKPNILELEQLLRRRIRDEACWRWASNQLATLLPGTTVLVSRGPEGMTMFDAGRRPRHIRALAREVFDVTGAGDTVVATLALAVASGVRIHQAAHLANRAAGIAVGKLGTAAVTVDQIVKNGRVAKGSDKESSACNEPNQRQSVRPAHRASLQ